MKYLSFLLIASIVSLTASAKVWRVNNNVGVVADFSTFYQAVAGAATGDTLYFEPSAIDYVTNSTTLSKRLVMVGPGYFLDPANSSEPANTGLQAATKDARLGFFYVGAGADGSKFLGVTIAGSVYLNAVNNISFEKVYFPAGIYFQSGTMDAISFRKCFISSAIYGPAAPVLTNFVCENNLFYGSGYMQLPFLTGSGNIFRNNSIFNNGNTFVLNNTYVANNIFGTAAQSTFTNCTIKNNIFQAAQTLPGTATGNLVSQSMTNVYVGGTTNSLDARAVLKSGSIAIGFGLTVGAVTSPDAGAFGATDPYHLSGIPNIPSIYTLTVPTSIPSGSTSMNITFSTRNNN